MCFLLNIHLSDDHQPKSAQIDNNGLLLTKIIRVSHFYFHLTSIYHSLTDGTLLLAVVVVYGRRKTSPHHGRTHSLQTHEIRLLHVIHLFLFYFSVEIETCDVPSHYHRCRCASFLCPLRVF